MNLGGRQRRSWSGSAELPRTLVNSYVVPTHASSAKDISVTAHCHAATAQLTREYQGDHRRYVLTPASTCAALPTPLDNTLPYQEFGRKVRFRVLAAAELRSLDGLEGRQVVLLLTFRPPL